MVQKFVQKPIRIVAMIEIVQARSDSDLDKANQLYREYLSWCVEEAKIQLGEELDLEDLYHHSLADQEAFLAGSGRLLLAKVNGEIGGITCLKKIRDTVCEIKRMYVQPRFRGKGLGRKLVSRVIDEARLIGYTNILLDSDPYMGKAHEIYRSLGFEDTDGYSEAEMDGTDYARHMVFMKLELVSD